MPDSQFLASQRTLTIKLDGKGPFIATKLLCEERLSAGCHLTVDMVSDVILQDNMLGKEVYIQFEQASNKRLFQAMLVSLEFIEYSQEKELYFYQITAQDPLSLLAYSYNRQIFQNMDSKKIIEKILENIGFKNYFTFSMSGVGKLHEYCTQMDETDLAFIQRIMASEGWHYRLDHQASHPIVIISDSNQSFSFADKSVIYYKDPSQDPNAVVTRWTQKNQLGFNKISLAEHSQNLAEILESGERKSSNISGQSNLSHYQFGQGLDNKNALRERAKYQQDAFDVQKNQAQSLSSIAQLSCGIKFKLAKHPIAALNQEYVITQITHVIEQTEASKQMQYQNRFICLPMSFTFRPPAIAFPSVHSIHSATVTGPQGEYIYRDKFGRVKVQFHWDRLGKNDENTSCWLPVSQGMASNGFGMQFIPRIGDEVLVQYIDGDPNRPVVMGSIYNNANQIPFASSFQNGIKTRTMPKGSSQQSNELRFDDQKDKEQIFLHAERDLMLEVNNDSMTNVTGRLTSSVEKDTQLNSKEKFEINSQQDVITNSKTNINAFADKDIKLSASNNIEIQATSSVKIDGQTICLQGLSKIELQVGASTIEISPTGISLNAPQVSICGTAQAELKAAMVTIAGQGVTDISSTVVKIEGSAMTQISAGAMVQIQGAITKVN